MRYWHIGSKSELLDALADAIMDDAIRAIPQSGPDDDWAEWLLTILRELRTAMLRHRDGARFLTLAGERFTFGYVLEEQARTDAAQRATGIDELQLRFPTTIHAIGEHFSAGRTSDDLFQDIVRTILGSPQRK
jgi:TetR/AcrR family tetracycline transcriptional repressor